MKRKRKVMAKNNYKKPSGQLRLSQLITTYGPGAIIEMPEYTGIIRGLEFWSNNKYDDSTLLSEPRLTNKLKTLLGKNYKLKTPPPDESAPNKPNTSVKVMRFPRWFMSQQIDLDKFKGFRSRLLIRETQLEKNEFLDDDKKKHNVMPVPYVMACPQGHIDDIDWRKFSHAKNSNTDGTNIDCDRQLWFAVRGSGGDIKDQFVRCECGASNSIATADDINNIALGYCYGKQPWLGNNEQEDCGKPNRLLLKNASNVYFPQTIGAISLPEEDQKLQNQIDSVWNYIEHVETIDDLNYERKKDDVKNALKDFSNEEVLTSIIKRKNSQDQKSKNVKEAEIELLVKVNDQNAIDNPVNYFQAEELARSPENNHYIDKINKIILVHKLREVVALIGFTRFEPTSVDLAGELDIGVKTAPLSKEANWLPAIENKGEGIFIEFSQTAIENWLNNQKLIARKKELSEAYEKWCQNQHGGKKYDLDIVYIMLHSLSHMLMTTIALDCGYPTSSLKERIYSFDGIGYGILIYTGSSGSEGTLGGLIEVGRNIEKYIKYAIESFKLCSNDPVCAQHDPTNEHEQRFLHGAACHGCLLISETSCEKRNEFLDRALVVSTIETNCSEFFEC